MDLENWEHTEEQASLGVFTRPANTPRRWLRWKELRWSVWPRVHREHFQSEFQTHQALLVAKVITLLIRSADKVAHWLINKVMDGEYSQRRLTFPTVTSFSCSRLQRFSLETIFTKSKALLCFQMVGEKEWSWRKKTISMCTLLLHTNAFLALSPWMKRSRFHPALFFFSFFFHRGLIWRSVGGQQ